MQLVNCLLDKFISKKENMDKKETGACQKCGYVRAEDYQVTQKEFSKRETQTINYKEVLRNEYDNLHSTNVIQLERQFGNRLSRCRDECSRCKINIQKVRNLLYKMKDIRDKEILGRCEYCMKYNPLGKCQRCKYLADKLRTAETERTNTYLKLFNEVNMFLQSFLEGDFAICHKMTRDSMSDLEKILNQLKDELAARELNVKSFPDKTDLMKNLAASEIMLHKLMNNMKTNTCNQNNPSDDSLYVSTIKALKDYTDKNFTEEKTKDFIKHTPLIHKPLQKNAQTANEKIPIKKNSLKTVAKARKLKAKSDKPMKDTKEKDGKDLKQPVDDITKKEQKGVTSKRDKPKNHRMTSEELMLARLVKERQDEKKKIEIEKHGSNKTPISTKLEKPKPMTLIANPLAVKVYSKHELVKDVSESIITCGNQLPLRPTEMIEGNKIVPLHYRDTNKVTECPEPLIFKTDIQCLDEACPQQLLQELAGAEMNIYRMIPANAKCDWFKRNKRSDPLFYASGEMLAEVFDDGRGKWYYRNGLVALEYSSGTEGRASPRYIIYSCEAGREGRVLACFDCFGNGVVYDRNGDVRLKYNQSEGMVIDKKIGPPGRWKWHALNEPPVIRPVYFETHDKDGGDELLHLFNDEDEANKPADPEMLTLELEHILREKTAKLIQKFKPFQIRMKALKVNEQFSVRIIDQANIYVLFRDGQVSLKQNLGMLLLSNEIIDTEISEVSQVSTPFDSDPALLRRAPSEGNIVSEGKEPGEREENREFPSVVPLILKDNRRDVHI